MATATYTRSGSELRLYFDNPSAVIEIVLVTQ
jgi:hypothetical protein